MARDSVSGDLGVAVQSHFFSVGSVVSWARPGVGAVATQSVADPAYGPRTLDGLAAGDDVGAALAAQLDADELRATRQVAAVSPAGAAVHTGPDCIPYAGHVEGNGFACQANMMARPGVPEAMAAAFAAAPGPLAERLVAALHAAEAAGGDVRGRQSAALVVVPAAGTAWERLELRVEDHADPVAELARLLVLRRAYDLTEAADELAAAGRAAEAGALYVRAAELAPASDELRFWAGLALADAGELERGAAMVREVAGRHAGWLALLDRLSADFAPAGAAVRAALQRNA